MKNNFLSAKKLVLLGIYEETYELYANLCSAISELDNIPNDTMNRQICKKPLNEYFSKVNKIFSDSRLCINDETPVFSMITVDEKKKFTYRLLSFSEFLNDIECLAWRILLKKNMQFGMDGKINSEILPEMHKNINDAIRQNTLGKDVLNREYIKYDLSANSKVINVYSNFHNLICNRQQHNIKPKIVTVKILNSEEMCNLPVNFCEECGDYFIGKTSLSLLQNELGILLAKFHDIEVENNSSSFANNTESELHSCGYNVIDDKLSRAERRDLLKYLLDNNVMTKFKLRKDIQNAIQIFTGRENFITAVKKWSEDLTFVDHYGNDEYGGNGIIK